MGKRKDLSDFDKGQIVMARRLGQSISKTAGLVGCSRFAVVSTYQKWAKEGPPVNRRQGHGRPRLIDANGEQKLVRLVQTHSRATVAQIAEKVNAGCDKKVSEHTVHRSLLRMGLYKRRLVIDYSDPSQSSKGSKARKHKTEAERGAVKEDMAPKDVTQPVNR